jgi:hypothetical protein
MTQGGRFSNLNDKIAGNFDEDDEDEDVTT